ncbi:MAG: SDR family oxidoreductase [Rubinisphaera brasiliensis]|uniref:SDR family oxidoreductase n=1 Tax=Rubinisphaera brasiliensis TaxID=119 RepID=UPI00391C1A35
MSILVTGATGQLGRRITQELLTKTSDVIAMVRSPEKGADLAELGAEIRVGNFNDRDSMRSAFDGVEVVALVTSKAHVKERIVQQENVLDAAQDAGVKRIVFASFATCQPDSLFHMAPFYLYAESRLRLSGLEWTILRNGMYLDPVADWIPDLIKMGRLPYPVDSGRIAYVCRDDLARSFAAASLDDSHAGEIYSLTGPESLSMNDLAAAISQATGKAIPFETVSENEFVEICRMGNESEEMIGILLSMYRAVDQGEFSDVTDDILTLTGQHPMTALEYLQQRCGSGK